MHSAFYVRRHLLRYSFGRRLDSFTSLGSDALREIHRVTKPGSYFSTAYPLHVPDSNPIFAEWFAPVLGNHAEMAGDMLPGEKTVSEAIPDGLYTDIDFIPLTLMNDYWNPEAIVKFYVQVINAFEPTMSTLPWKAQEDMIHILIERGRDIVATYGWEKLKFPRPAQFLKARVVK